MTKAKPSTPDPEAAAAIGRALERQSNGWLVPQTATTAAKALGIDPKTMVKLLREAGLEIGQNKTYTLKDVVDCSVGSLERETIRLRRADANIREMDEAVMRKDLISKDEVDTILRSTLLVLRQNLMNLPSELATLVNPTDPQLAREQAALWLDRKLPRIREAISELRNVDETALSTRLRRAQEALSKLRALLAALPVVLAKHLKGAKAKAAREALAQWIETEAMPVLAEKSSSSSASSSSSKGRKPETKRKRMTRTKSWKPDTHHPEEMSHAE